MKKPLMHLGLALALVMGAIGGYVFASYMLGTESARSSALLSDIAAKRDAQEASARARAALLGADAERAAIHGYFVEPEGVVAFLEGLEDTGASVGSRVTVASVVEVTEPRPHLDIALKIDGSFAPVMRTIGMLEYGPHDLTVSQLTLAEGRDDEGSAWTATMTISVGARNLTPGP